MLIKHSTLPKRLSGLDGSTGSLNKVTSPRILTTSQSQTPLKGNEFVLLTLARSKSNVDEQKMEDFSLTRFLVNQKANRAVSPFRRSQKEVFRSHNLNVLSIKHLPACREENALDLCNLQKEKTEGRTIRSELIISEANRRKEVVLKLLSQRGASASNISPFLKSSTKIDSATSKSQFTQPKKSLSKQINPPWIRTNSKEESGESPLDFDKDGFSHTVTLNRSAGKRGGTPKALSGQTPKSANGVTPRKVSGITPKNFSSTSGTAAALRISTAQSPRINRIGNVSSPRIDLTMNKTMEVQAAPLNQQIQTKLAEFEQLNQSVAMKQKEKGYLEKFIEDIKKEIQNERDLLVMAQEAKTIMFRDDRAGENLRLIRNEESLHRSLEIQKIFAEVCALRSEVDSIKACQADVLSQIEIEKKQIRNLEVTLQNERNSYLLEVKKKERIFKQASLSHQTMIAIEKNFIDKSKISNKLIEQVHQSTLQTAPNESNVSMNYVSNKPSRNNSFTQDQYGHSAANLMRSDHTDTFQATRKGHSSFQPSSTGFKSKQFLKTSPKSGQF